MKKVYIIMMVLMTCMCLTTQSCSSGDDEDSANQNNYSFSYLGRMGTYQGYWMVFGQKADSCAMTYDGKVLSFSKLPLGMIMAYFDYYRSHGVFPKKVDYFTDNTPDSHYSDSYDVQLEAGPLVVLPVVVGYSENNCYFNSSVQKMDHVNSGGNYEANYSDMYYSYRTKSGDKTTFYSFVFDRDTYGVYNAEQKSRVIKLYIKVIEITLPGPGRECITETFNPMMELTFISND